MKAHQNINARVYAAVRRDRGNRLMATGGGFFSMNDNRVRVDVDGDRFVVRHGSTEILVDTPQEALDEVAELTGLAHEDPRIAALRWSITQPEGFLK